MHSTMFLQQLIILEKRYGPSPHLLSDDRQRVVVSRTINEQDSNMLQLGLFLYAGTCSLPPTLAIRTTSLMQALVI